MRFAEAEQRYRELEDQLSQGRLTEQEFFLRVAELQTTDDQGRRWMISARTRRWQVYNGQAWVASSPPRPDRETPAAVPGPAASRAGAEASSRRSGSLRCLGVGLLALVLAGCLLGIVAIAWVLLSGPGGDTAVVVDTAEVALVATYTARPATATYTPTATPTPSRTPVPTATSIPTNTPIPTTTPPPTATPVPPTPLPSPTPPPSPTMAPTPTATPTPSPTQRPGVTHVVKVGETLSEIAAQYGVTVRALADANGITNPALIRPGQVLVIPIPGTTPGAGRTATPTWTPIALATRTKTPSPTPTRTGGTPKPTATPKATATPKPPVLSGKIAFAVWNPLLDGGKYELFVSKIDGTGRNNLGVGFRQPQFRSDGGMLVMNGDRSEEYEHLNVINPNGEGLREISEHSEDGLPAWSPDGAQVVYSTAAWGDGRVLLAIVYDQYGRQWSWVRYGNTELQGEYPFWLADGRIIYRGCDFWAGGGNCGLWVVGAGGGNPQPVTAERSDTAPAAFQNKVAFMSSRDGNWEIYTVNTDGSGLKRLTNHAAEDGLPTWSPDGKSIAFVSSRDGSWAIWVMNADGKSQRKLFDLGGGYGAGPYDWTSERITWAP